jgi:hypothetical protein
VFAHGMRSGMAGMVCLAWGLSFGPQASHANPSGVGWEFALSQDRLFVLDPESQSWQRGALGHPLSAWGKIPSPKRMFRALHVFAGPAGGVYVQDAIEPRLCLFDTAGQLLSCRPFPEEFKNRRSNRVLIVPRKDGRFVFVDTDKGEASIWREARSDDANSHWQRTVVARMPMNLRRCWEAPWYANLCCEGSGTFQCYDPFLNAFPNQPESTWIASSQLRLWRNGDGSIRGFKARPVETEQQTFCFDNQTGFVTCP